MRILITIVLLQTFLFNANAQNNYVQFTGDVDTRVADIAESGFLTTAAKLTAYSVELNGGNKDLGLVKVNYSNVLQMSSQFHYNNMDLYAKKVLPGGEYILAERVDHTARHFKRPVIIKINSSTGTLVYAVELPNVPFPYVYTSILDFVQDNTSAGLRILCNGNGNSTNCIFEVLFNTTTFQCTFLRYDPQQAMNEIQFLGYIKHYHNSEDMLGELSFYGTAIMSSGNRKGFIYFKDYNVPYVFQTYQFSNSQLIGFMVNGTSSGGSIPNIITMAMTSHLDPSNICIQQKVGLSTLVWRKFYHTQDLNAFYFGYGRGGHGVKGYSTSNTIDYFIGTHENLFATPKVTVLRYEASNGTIQPSPQFNFTNTDNKTSWPNFTDDPSQPYYFVVDRYNHANGFKMADANSTDDNTACTDPISFVEVTGDLDEQNVVMDITDYPTPVASTTISLIRTEITTNIIPECNTEQRTPPVVFKRRDK